MIDFAESDFFFCKTTTFSHNFYNYLEKTCGTRVKSVLWGGGGDSHNILIKSEMENSLY